MISIDSNVLARHLLRDIPDQAARSSWLLKRASMGEVQLFVPTTAVAEITWLLIRQRGVPKNDVADTLIGLLQARGIVLENAQAVISALRLLRSTGGLSYVDCYHLAITAELGMSQIYSFDKKMDRYPGIERIEPELPVGDEA